MSRQTKVGNRRRVLRRFLRNRLAIIGMVIVAIYIFIAIFAPLISPMDPLKQNLSDKRIPPNKTHLLGTDQFGRDILSRILYGTQYALLVSSMSILLSLVFGTLFGLIAGYFGGAIDEVIMRITWARNLEHDSGNRNLGCSHLRPPGARGGDRHSRQRIHPSC